MQNNKNKIYFNFSYDVLKLLGDGLYSNPWTAISELIANGIDANATRIYLHINMVNKQSSTIEIFDNGYGMNYKNLVEKYAFIGKNKRADIDLDDIQKEKVMGRKGIGKLAALYLSSTFYLISKTEKETSSWCFDTNNSKNDNMPHLKRSDEIQIESKRQWQACKTGTLIKLINVDLTNIGEQTIVGIKARIADYYSFNENSIEFLVSFKQNPNEKIVFESAEKQIAYKNFYAFFDNTNMNFTNNLQREILLKTKFPEEMPNTKKIIEATNDVCYKKCPVKILNNVFITSGEEKFIDNSGKKSSKPYKFELIGWIGIHSTIEKGEAKLNDKIFIKNKAYQPNRLRLYVRNKLAVENFMEYLRNTQAFGKYIEGEIHFNILDDNNLPDIATADREDYKEDNDRIKKLIEILKPIINSLIKNRISIGHQIRNEEKEYFKLKEEQQKAETAKAQEETKKAKFAQDKAETRTKKAEEELEKQKRKNIFQSSMIGQEKEQIMGLQHQIKHSASRIKKNVSDLFKYLKKRDIDDESVVRPLSTISTESNNIEAIAKYVTKANFNLMATEIKEDIVCFIQEYIKEIFEVIRVKYPEIIIKNIDNSKHVLEFRPLEVSSMIDNLVFNAKKAKANNIIFVFKKHMNNLEIKVSDDGTGISKNNLANIFDFGYTTTDGSGIGLFMVKKCIDNLKGRIEVISKENKGTTFIINL